MRIIKNFLVPLANKISDDELFTRSAAVAYYASLALAPTIMLIASLLGLLQINIVHHLAIQTNRLIGYEVGELVLALAEYSKNHVQFASISGLFGVAILLISGSFLFSQVENTMAHIFKDLVNDPESENSNYWRYVSVIVKTKLLSVLVFLSGVIIALVSLCLSFLLSRTLGDYAPTTYKVIYEVGNFLVFAFLFFIVYRTTPARRIKNRNIVLGSMITAALFLAGKELIAWYIANAGIGSVYGAAGSIIVFLVWVYYSSLTIFFGAEIIAVSTTGATAPTPQESPQKNSHTLPARAAQQH